MSQMPTDIRKSTDTSLVICASVFSAKSVDTLLPQAFREARFRRVFPDASTVF